MPITPILQTQITDLIDKFTDKNVETGVKNILKIAKDAFYKINNYKPETIKSFLIGLSKANIDETKKETALHSIINLCYLNFKPGQFIDLIYGCDSELANKLIHHVTQLTIKNLIINLSASNTEDVKTDIKNMLSICSNKDLQENIQKIAIGVLKSIYKKNALSNNLLIESFLEIFFKELSETKINETIKAETLYYVISYIISKNYSKLDDFINKRSNEKPELKLKDVESLLKTNKPNLKELLKFDKENKTNNALIRIILQNKLAALKNEVDDTSNNLQPENIKIILELMVNQPTDLKNKKWIINKYYENLTYEGSNLDDAISNMLTNWREESLDGVSDEVLIGILSTTTNQELIKKIQIKVQNYQSFCLCMAEFRLTDLSKEEKKEDKIMVLVQTLINTKLLTRYNILKNIIGTTEIVKKYASEITPLSAAASNKKQEWLDGKKIMDTKLMDFAKNMRIASAYETYSNIMLRMTYLEDEKTMTYSIKHEKNMLNQAVLYYANLDSKNILSAYIRKLYSSMERHVEK